jgi:hypothetical protein
MTTVPTADGDGTDGFKSVVIAAIDDDSKTTKRKSNMSQQFRTALKDLAMSI